MIYALNHSDSLCVTAYEMYAKTYFETLNFDAITLSPYMGYDSIQPYLKYKNKWVILLALTSNKGSEDFQKYNNLNQKCQD